MSSKSLPLGLARVCLAGSMAAAMIAAPVSLSDVPTGIVVKTALAKRGGDDGGGDRGDHDRGDHGERGDSDHSGGHDRDDGDHDRGHDRGDRDHARSDDDHGDHHGRGERAADGRDLRDLLDDLGRGRDRERFTEARERYRDALEHAEGEHRGRGRGRGEGRHHGEDEQEVEREHHEVAHRLSRDETRDLIEHGWRGRERNDGFKNHGERVRTMVELAKELGYGARVGALQANFGTPFENGIADLQAELAEARAEHEAKPDDADAAARVEQLETKLEGAIEAAKPGNGPDDDWATADLDVNDDGIVDRRDLTALEDQPESDAGEVSSRSPSDPPAS